jgi:hypothetical protein
VAAPGRRGRHFFDRTGHHGFGDEKSMPSSNETKTKRKRKPKSIDTRRKGYAEENERRRRRYAEDPEYRERHLARNRVDSVKALGWSLKRRYVISLQDYARLLARQGGVCAICLRQPPKRLCIDHCHATAKVRGLLCRTCNTGLGFYRDDAALLTAAAAYLRNSSS